MQLALSEPASPQDSWWTRALTVTARWTTHYQAAFGVVRHEPGRYVSRAWLKPAD